MRTFWAILLASMLAFAGCLDEGDDGDDGDGTGTETPGPGGSGNQTGQDPIVLTGTGMTGVSAGTGGNSAGFAGENAEIDVPDGVTTLHAELRWNDPVQDVDLALSSPDQEGTSPRIFEHTTSGGSPGSPDSPHSLTIAGPMAGTWILTAFGNGATAAMEYEWAVTLFFDDMPDGYTAFE